MPSLPGQRPANPFGSRFTRPGALPFLPSIAGANSLDQFADQILQSTRSAIVGPHGSGKTTLLHALCNTPAFQHRAISPDQIIVLRQGESHAHLWDHLTNCPQSALVILDGYEQLSCWQRLRFVRWGRRQSTPLLVTSHHPLRLFTCHRHTPPSLPVARKLAESLLSDHPHLVDSLLADFDELWQASQGNMRDLWSTLYDRYELS
jgi:hypothetical protein